MYSTLTKLIDKLDNLDTSSTNVISWGCPVPSFGSLSRARVATLGLNPNNLEFMDHAGNELQGPSRRFHTLRSLGLSSWSEADVRHLRMIVMSCEEYFVRNPYDRWFRRLNSILSGVGASYYNSIFPIQFLRSYGVPSRPYSLRDVPQVGRTHSSTTLILVALCR